MRKFVFFMILLTGAVLFCVACGRSDDVPKADAEIYFADARLGRLLPYSDEIIDGDTVDMARDALRLIIEGRDNNENIRRIIPNMSDALSVRLSENVAYVDINPKIKAEMNYSRDIEKLFIYQITNTLTSIKGIRFVRFTVGGGVRKDFLGFYDMREAYKFTYPE